MCEIKILFWLKIYDRLRQATAKRIGCNPPINPPNSLWVLDQPNPLCPWVLVPPKNTTSAGQETKTREEEEETFWVPGQWVTPWNSASLHSVVVLVRPYNARQFFLAESTWKFGAPMASLSFQKWFWTLDTQRWSQLRASAPKANWANGRGGADIVLLCHLYWTNIVHQIALLRHVSNIQQRRQLPPRGGQLPSVSENPLYKAIKS